MINILSCAIGSKQQKMDQCVFGHEKVQFVSNFDFIFKNHSIYNKLHKANVVLLVFYKSSFMHVPAASLDSKT